MDLSFFVSPDFVLLVLTVVFLAIFFIEEEGRRFTGLASLFFFILLVMSSFFVSVPAGSVGVVTNFGKVQDGTLGPGLHFLPPFVNNVVNIDTRVQPHNFQAIDAATQENLSVKVTGTMNYHIDPQFASVLYQNVGTDFASKIIDPAFSDYIKQVVPAYSADSSKANFILNKRDEIRATTKEQLGANLARYHIIVDDIYIVDVAYPQAFDESITAKQVAQQQVQTETQVLQQKQIQAQQAVAVAQGQADAQVVQAQAQAKANKLISESLTEAIIQFTLVNKLAPGIQTIILPAGQPLLLDAKSFAKQ